MKVRIERHFPEVSKTARGCRPKEKVLQFGQTKTVNNVVISLPKATFGCILMV